MFCATLPCCAVVPVQTLAYNAGLYGRAQALRKAGQAPKVLGIADDLPDRFAFHQLEQLAGMARKVRGGTWHWHAEVEGRYMVLPTKALCRMGSSDSGTSADGTCSHVSSRMAATAAVYDGKDTIYA